MPNNDLRTNTSGELNNRDGWTLLDIAARFLSEGLFIALINKTDVNAINQAILLQNDIKWSPLHVAARYQSEKAFIALIDKTDSNAINQAILLQNNTKWSPLHTAAQYQSENAFIALIDKIDVNAINQAILLQNNTKWSPLHTTARVQSEKAFITLIDKIDANAINQAILLQNDENWSPLHMAARYQSEKAFITLIDKTDTNAINQAILLQHNTKNSPLHTAARFQSEKAFITLIDKTDKNTINQAILLQHDEKWSPLHVAARYQSEKAFIALINKTDTNAINQAILLQNDEKWSPLHMTARFQSEKAFIKLIGKINRITLENCLTLKNNKNKSCLDFILEFQSQNSTLAVIKKISEITLNTCLSVLSNTSLTLLFHKMFNSPCLTNEILGKLTNDTATYLAGKLSNHTLHGLPLIQSLLLEKTLKDKVNPYAPNQNNTFKTSKGNNISFNDPNLIEIIKQQGFHSRDDVALLLSNKGAINHPLLIDLVKELDTFNLLFKGGLTRYHAPPLLASALQEKIENYEILYKMVKPKLIDSYIAQFNDYTIRPNNLRSSKPTATHKFHHLTGEIKAYQPKINHNCNKQTIKKNSTTLLSPELVTPVFGEQHNDARPLVGLLFDLKQCNIKAMLKHDVGTVNRDWVGTWDEVSEYKATATNLNYTNFTQFKQAIQHSVQLNEVLAEIPKEAILGIFMRDTRLKSKEIALDYANKIKSTLNLDLPIYHYSSTDKAILPYPKERIEHHLEIFSVEIAKTLRHGLLHSSYDLRFWGGQTYTAPDKSITKRLPQTAYDIITKIDTLLIENNTDKINKELNNIENLLEIKLMSTVKRTATTVNSYEANLIKLKNR